MNYYLFNEYEKKNILFGVQDRVKGLNMRDFFNKID